MRIYRFVRLLLLGSILSPFAASAFFDGNCPSFYAGPTIGTGIVNLRYKANNGFSDTHYAKGGINSLLGGGVLGYQTTCDCTYFAAQINALLNSLNDTYRLGTDPLGTPSHGVNVTNQFQYGIDLRFGYIFNSVTPYILAGVQAGKWQMKLSNATGANVRGIPIASTLTFSKTRVGPKFGFGVSFPVFCDLSFNFEYNYSIFGKVRTALTDANRVTWHHKQKINQNAVLIGLNWCF